MLIITESPLEYPKSNVVDRLEADPDPMFHFDTDTDPASSNVVDP